jgi:hypothetical protein
MINEPEGNEVVLFDDWRSLDLPPAPREYIGLEKITVPRCEEGVTQRPFCIQRLLCFIHEYLLGNPNTRIRTAIYTTHCKPLRILLVWSCTLKRWSTPKFWTVVRFTQNIIRQQNEMVSLDDWRSLDVTPPARDSIGLTKFTDPRCAVGVTQWPFCIQSIVNSRISPCRS